MAYIVGKNRAREVGQRILIRLKNGLAFLKVLPGN